MNEDLLLNIYKDTSAKLDESESLLDQLEPCGQRYTNLQQINSGGMKEIHSCHDTHTDCDVILAAPKKPEHNPAFVREGRINAFLQHPNIMPIYDLGLLEDDRPYFTMKKLNGKSLDSCISENKDHQFETLVDAFIKVCDAVAYAHSRSIIHQDLKPDNILLDDFGEVIVADWGLAEIDDQMNENEFSILDKELHNIVELTLKGSEDSMHGTPGYIAPERYTKSPPDCRHDIYALGAVLYTILCGEKPKQIKQTSLPVAVFTKENLPASLKAICHKAMNPNPELRYANCSEMLEELHRFRRGFATEAENASVIRLFELLYKRNKRLFISSTISLFIIFILIIVSFVLINDSRRKALQEKEKAIQAKEEIQQLYKDLEEKEKAKNHFMKMGAKRQLGIIKSRLKTRNLKNFDEAIKFTLSLDPELEETHKFVGSYHLAMFNIPKSLESLGKLKDKSFFKLVKKTDFSSTKTILTQIESILKEIEPSAIKIFLENCIKRSNATEQKTAFLIKSIMDHHPGMIHIPKITVEENSGRTLISMKNKVVIKHTGPIHLLNPYSLDMSGTSFGNAQIINLCDELQELNVSRTTLVGVGKIINSKLKKINFSHTHIKNANEFISMPNLEFIDASFSKMINFKGFTALPKLKTLVVSKNQLRSAQKSLPGIDIIVNNSPDHSPLAK
ncbi:MAG: serine/threonine protein kinase [Lentisphaerales bacterium]|nr:serine/threonine protein kinase [Lentisphaerales bacterium]